MPSLCPRHAWYSWLQRRLSRATTGADSPFASGPTSAASASRMSPVDTPCRYSHGSAASSDFALRTYGGTSVERNTATCSVRERALGKRTLTAPRPVNTSRCG